MGILLKLTGVNKDETASAPIYSLKNQPGISVVVADFSLGPIDVSIIINQGVALFELTFKDPENEEIELKYQSIDMVSHDSTIVFNTIETDKEPSIGIRIFSERDGSLYIIDMFTEAIDEFNKQIETEIEQEGKEMAALYA